MTTENMSAEQQWSLIRYSEGGKVHVAETSRPGQQVVCGSSKSAMIRSGIALAGEFDAVSCSICKGRLEKRFFETKSYAPPAPAPTPKPTKPTASKPTAKPDRQASLRDKQRVKIAQEARELEAGSDGRVPANVAGPNTSQDDHPEGETGGELDPQ